MYNLLAILQTIIQSYSHLNIKELFENHLSLSISLFSNNQIAKNLFKYKFPSINKSKQQLFFKNENFLQNSSLQSGLKNQSSAKQYHTQKQIYAYITVNHPKMLPLHKNILSKSKLKKQSFQDINKNSVQGIICLTTQNQTLDNIFSVQERYQSKMGSQPKIKAFFMKIPLQQNGIHYVISQVSLLLSINQFFHSHVGLVLSIHQIVEYKNLENVIAMSEKQFEEDDDELLSCSEYCRIFQALPFKLTYDDIANLADIQTQYWGQVIRIEQGTDGVLFWCLLNHYPILLDQQKIQNKQFFYKPFKASIPQKKVAQKYGLKLFKEHYGHIVFKSKGMIKQSLQDLALTIVIINLKRAEYCLSIDKIFGTIFQKQIKKYSQNKLKARQFLMCEQVSNEVDKLSQLLAQIRVNPFGTECQQLIENQKKIEAQQLSYNIKRWLFIKEKQ